MARHTPSEWRMRMAPSSLLDFAVRQSHPKFRRSLRHLLLSQTPRSQSKRKKRRKPNPTPSPLTLQHFPGRMTRHRAMMEPSKKKVLQSLPAQHQDALTAESHLSELRNTAQRNAVGSSKKKSSSSLALHVCQNKTQQLQIIVGLVRWQDRLL
mmetsp:Transcript_29540/g.71981  ORF Transcript_29540/g.71981 Transcript_29540/m.71981 type:complete len:153 (-) Transcript_29540:114-572(-)